MEVPGVVGCTSTKICDCWANLLFIATLLASLCSMLFTEEVVCSLSSRFAVCCHLHALYDLMKSTHHHLPSVPQGAHYCKMAPYIVLFISLCQEYFQM